MDEGQEKCLKSSNANCPGADVLMKLVNFEVFDVPEEEVKRYVFYIYFQNGWNRAIGGIWMEVSRIVTKLPWI